MADYEELFPGKYLKSSDLKGRDATVTIKTVSSETIEEKLKAIFSFEGTAKLFVCNRTNAEACKLMFGRDYTKWIGKRITLYPATMKDPFGDGEITALRVRGSPDITSAASAEVKRGRKTLKVSVIPTGRPAPAKTNGAAPAPVKNTEPSDEEKAAALEAERAQSASEGLPS